MHNKKAFDVSIKELIYLVLLVIAVIILWPKISYIVHNWIKTAPEDVERQFDALIPDIAAVENGKSKIVPFAVNKDEEIYKLATHKACTEKENPQENTARGKMEGGSCRAACNRQQGQGAGIL